MIAIFARKKIGFRVNKSNGDVIVLDRNFAKEEEEYIYGLNDE